MKIICNFAASHIHKGVRTRLIVAGFFYACTLQLYGSIIPGNFFKLLSLVECDNGKVEPFLFSTNEQILSVMSHTEKICPQVNNSTLPTTSIHETDVTIYVDKSSEITEKIKEFTEKGYICYRTRLECGCEKDNRRDGAIVLSGEKTIAQIVKCKGCCKKIQAEADEIKAAKQQVFHLPISAETKALIDCLPDFNRLYERVYDAVFDYLGKRQCEIFMEDVENSNNGFFDKFFALKNEICELMEGSLYDDLHNKELTNQKLKLWNKNKKIKNHKRS